MRTLYRSLKHKLRNEVRVAGWFMVVWYGLMWLMTAACVAGYLYAFVSNLRWFD